MKPVLEIVAIDGLLLCHRPFVVGVMDDVAPTHTAVGPVKLTTGLLFTVIGAVGLDTQPLPLVNVNVALPALTAVTTPLFVTVATEVLLDVQIPPVDGDNVLVNPTQMMSSPVIDTDGLLVTVNGEEETEVQFEELLTNVNVTIPVPTAVANPLLLIVAIEVLLLVHVPPVDGSKLVVPLMHIFFGPL
jgi:hypothetical protein